MACPTCGGTTRPREENAAFPFCGERCRMADLGRWFNEEFRVPTEEPPEPASGGGDDEPT